jgi:GAF domain-containing protein
MSGLAEEQAALRRVATLVARGTAPEEVFAAVAEEVGRLLPVDMVNMCRYEPDRTLTFLASWDSAGQRFPVGSRRTLGGHNLGTIVFETGRPARIDGYADRSSGPLGAATVEAGIRSAVGTPIVAEGRLWGVISAGSSREQLLPPDAEARLASFTELVATAIANAESRAALGRLAQEQAALRRVATLVARGAAPEEVFAAVAEEAGKLLPVELVTMSRYEAGRMMTFLGSWGGAAGQFPVGSQRMLQGHKLGTLVFETGRPARVDSYADATSPLAAPTREAGIRSSVGTPIIVEGRLWGVIGAGSTREQPLPPDAEARLASFTELVATAVANAESRAALARLAEEQAALRRIATLVARGAPPEEVFAAVADEVGQLIHAEIAGIVRYDADGMGTIVAISNLLHERFPIGSRWALGGKNVYTAVFETGRPARLDSYDDASGSFGTAVRETGFRSSAGAPIIVQGRVWGVMAATSRGEQPLPPDTEARLASFTELVATAIANAASRAELTASRARIVAAADESRRRIERDLHDGTQQQLVSLMLDLRSAEATEPSEVGELRAQLAQTADGLRGVLEELQEISRGIHPAILSKGGLEPALRTLARRSALSVNLDLRAGRRLPEAVEVAAYYVVSEALANAAKHADASAVHVELDVHDATMRLAIRDDGAGGADPGQGSGLIGLSDRIQALGGTFQVISPAGGGTTLIIEVPVALFNASPGYLGQICRRQG